MKKNKGLLMELKEFRGSIVPGAPKNESRMYGLIIAALIALLEGKR